MLLSYDLLLYDVCASFARPTWVILISYGHTCLKTSYDHLWVRCYTTSQPSRGNHTLNEFMNEYIHIIHISTFWHKQHNLAYTSQNLRDQCSRSCLPINPYHVFNYYIVQWLSSRTGTWLRVVVWWCGGGGWLVDTSTWHAFVWPSQHTIDRNVYVEAQSEHMRCYTTSQPSGASHGLLTMLCRGRATFYDIVRLQSILDRQS